MGLLWLTEEAAVMICERQEMIGKERNLIPTTSMCSSCPGRARCQANLPAPSLPDTQEETPQRKDERLEEPPSLSL